MTANTQLQPTAGDQPSPSGPKAAPRWRSELAAGLSPRNIGAVYVLIVICIVFSIWAPNTFPQGATIKQVLDNNAITALAALALIVPLSARVFDLSFAYVMSLSGVTAAHFVAADNWPVLLALLAGIGAALVIGLVNGFVVVIMRIDSFIGTLATGSLVQAFISFVTNDNSINSERLSGSFSTMSQGSIGGIIYPVFYAVIIAAALWVFMDHTATGRRLYATGFNPNAARLADIRVNKLRFCSLLVSAAWPVSPASCSPPRWPRALRRPVPRTCCPASRRYSSAPPCSSTAGSTPGARSSPCSCSAPAWSAWAWSSAPLWAIDMFTGVVLIAALSANSFERRNLLRGRGTGSRWLPVRSRTT